MTLSATATIFAAGVLLAAGCASDPAPLPASHATLAMARIHIEFRGIRAGSGSGPVRLALWSSADGFMKDGCWIQGITIPIDQCADGVDFEPVPVGTYAVSAFHDTTDCGRFRRNAFGLPLDPWAVSGDGPAWLPPSWSNAAFELGEGGATVELDFSHGRRDGKDKGAAGNDRPKERNGRDGVPPQEHAP